MANSISATRVVGAVGGAGLPLVVSGSFTANGASAPVVVGGEVVSVTRYVDAGAAPFFRVKFSGALHPDVTVTACANPTNAASPLAARCVNDRIVIDPTPIAREVDELDIALYNTADLRVDTTDTIVHIQIIGLR